MVAAGIYLMTRIFPFFSASATAMTVILAISTLTLLISSTIGMVATDIKQVWAYSTISQLGFMAMGLAAPDWPPAPCSPAITTSPPTPPSRLCSSSVPGSSSSLRHQRFFHDGQQRGPEAGIPMVCMTIAALALSGIPPFSGFFSKELIMGALGHLPNKLWLAMGLLGAFLTAYYSFRVIFVMLFPKPGAYGKVPGHVEAHPGQGHAHGDATDEHHGVPWVMVFPLIVLAVFTLTLGFCEGYLQKFLLGKPGPEALNYFLMAGALCCGVGGIAVAWFDWGAQGARCQGFIQRVPWLQEFFIQQMVHGPLLALVPQHRDLRHFFPVIYLQ